MFKQLKLPFTGGRKQQSQADSSDEYQPEDDERKSEPSSLWTRVKAVDTWKSTTVTVFDFEKDAKSDLTTSQARHHIQGQSGKCLFDPDEYGFKGVDYSMSTHRLTDENLRWYGRLASKVRKQFDIDAETLRKIFEHPNDELAQAEL